MYRVIVWHNLNKNTYYYKIIRGTYNEYRVGYINHYNHKIIVIVEDIYLHEYKVPLRKRVISRLISFLQRINK